MKTKEQIIKEVAVSIAYIELCKNICKGNQLHKDLFQELIIILSTQEETKLIELERSNQLKFFIIRILQNQWSSTTSPFYKTHKKFEAESNEIGNLDLKEEAEIENDVLLISDLELNKGYYKDKDSWYRNNLVTSYLQSGSMRKLECKTGISRVSIANTVTNFREHILKLKHKLSLFVEKELTCIRLTESTKKVIFFDAQKNNLEPDRYIEKILLEASKKNGKTK